MVLSLGLAQLFNQRFPGRRYARWAIIAPWAASVMMTALIFRWMLQPDNGVVYVFWQYTVDWQHPFAASVVATIPVFLLFALIEGRVVGGLTAGSIK
jgi:ABC-type sugar transport system permease subunit